VKIKEYDQSPELLIFCTAYLEREAQAVVRINYVDKLVTSSFVVPAGVRFKGCAVTSGFLQAAKPCYTCADNPKSEAASGLIC
jgi:hypothetical protein